VSCEYLLEILTEEIPANALPGIREQLLAGFRDELAEAGFGASTVTTYATLRRMVVHAAGLPAVQPDREEEVTGPPVRAAFADDGGPTPAAIGFAKSLGVKVEELRVVKGAKGDVLAGSRRLAGRPTPEVLAEITVRVVPGLRVPKSMRWGRGEHTFVRPVHNVVALFGGDSGVERVPVSLFGVPATTSTAGHRVVAPGRIELKGTVALAAYRDTLARAGVVLDRGERERTLAEKADALAREVGCAVRPDPALLAELSELVEHPGLLRGTIAGRFLDLPAEVLSTTLRHHQKCLLLTKDGALAPHFLAVCDRPDDPEGQVQRGNEWVAGARLTDAAFFFAQDRKAPLAARREALPRVLVHQKLGSFADKSEIVAALAKLVAGAAKAKVSPDALARACVLLKLDLTTAMVGEFPELQGVMGGIYAQRDGEPDEVWQAIGDQYTPAGLEGALPRNLLGAVIGVADRLDSLAGMFAIGEVPSGSKDPFALRRAALAVVRICAEAPLRCDLRALAHEALELRARFAGGETKEAEGALLEFLQERVRYYLTSVTGVRPDVADAVLAAHWGVLADDVARAQALEAVKREPAFASLAEAFKRVRNMVAKGGAGKANAKLLVENAERALRTHLDGVARDVQQAVRRGDYLTALRAFATLAEPLDAFFTDVLVLCEDKTLRAARLALLAEVEKLFLGVADVSRLAAQ
jgi:glycyl-tRNA synthetase beta chain